MSTSQLDRAPTLTTEEAARLISRADECSRLAAMAGDVELTERLLELAQQYLTEAEQVMRARAGTLRLGTTTIH